MPAPLRRRIAGRGIRRRTLAAAAAICLAGCSHTPTNEDLKITSIQRADCTPSTDLPVYRFIAATADGSVLPTGASLGSSTDITVDKQTFHPFYAAPFGSDGRLRFTQILLDVSGSMKGKPFETARNAAASFLSDFNPAVDRVSVAAFGSRDVAAQIKSAQFLPSADLVRKAISSIEAPRPENNTALYSAVNAGLDALAAEGSRATGDPQLLLVVLTDGQNDLSATDRARDPSLLTGDAGLKTVVARLRTSRVQTFTIGFGRQVNENDLRLLGRGETRIVQSAEQLGGVFSDARRMSTHSAEMAFAIPESLHPSGRDMTIRVAVHSSGVQVLGTGLWRAPQFSPGVAEGACSVDEKKAALELPSARANDLLRTATVFLIIGAVLALLWFAIPRLFWNDYEPEHYRAAPSIHSEGSDSGRPRGGDDPTQAVPKSDESRYRT